MNGIMVRLLQQSILTPMSLIQVNNAMTGMMTIMTIMMIVTIPVDLAQTPVTPTHAMRVFVAP